MKLLSKVVFALYIVLLLWLVLFKFSFEIFSIIVEHQDRSFAITLFAGHWREMVDNFVIFIPFGLLLGVNFTSATFVHKLAIIFGFSFAIETLQYVVAIGITDITDLALNTLGGLVGLVLYSLATKYIDSKKINYFIIIVGLLIAATLLFFRFFVLKVRY